MKAKLVWAWVLLTILPLQARTDNRYVEVTGTSEIEIVPDKIHYLIEIREYFEEEFDGKSKPGEYRTKVPLSRIEHDLRAVLTRAGVPVAAVRTQEVGDYWRERGEDFRVSKRFDITLSDFRQIDRIVSRIDTRGIQMMRIGELENKELQEYHRKGKIEALEAARRKAAYLVESLGKELGDVLRIVEDGTAGVPPVYAAQSNVRSSDAYSFDGFRTIKKTYSVRVRFEIVDK
ncbi:MAG: SIMPL domain-containing protein [Parabacteroides sp.]|nr:SIMPL domain-containing protein [Parabacteroides sp.]